MSPKIRVEAFLQSKVSNSEFLLAARYVENEVGFLVNGNCPDAIIRLMAKHVQEQQKEQQKGAVRSSNS